jgi:hypothetical protein
MMLNGFAGRTVLQVERENTHMKVLFQDGGYLYVRALGPAGTRLKVTCTHTQCQPCHCDSCRGIEPAGSD